MWDDVKALPFGRMSIRNMCIFAAAVFVASFMYILLASPTAHAADAEWNGDTIVYSGNTYTKLAPAKAGDSHGLPAGTIIYGYVEPSTSSPATPTTKAHLIYFAPGTDPTTAATGTYVTYNFTAPSTYTNASGTTNISLSPQTGASEGTTSCAVEGIGWIVCPITNFLASAMDHLFNILAGFLTVRPVQTNQENALYRAWSYMRNFANISFVIAFLIIIYSQITTIGLSNYDIKKMLPRLIIAAVLVNISYWICAAAIDISNILGWSIQDIFISIRNNLVGAEGNSWDVFSWKSIGGLILSGGTATAAAGFGAYSLLLSAGAVSSALYMLLPILVGVIVAVLVALLVMAARQAIITILLIISPLAFVAYLLPNTEKYYEKWQQLGMTMLLLFPIFSVIFGGSQLAGMAIIQNADSINLILLGMGVQVAPVVVTPLLVRFSGSLLARIGGIVNNPGKGLIDRTRKFAEERRDQRKAALFARPLDRKRDAIARLGRSVDTKRRTREGWQKANEAIADANWANTQANSDIQQRVMQASLTKDIGETNAQARFEASKATSAAMQGLDVNARASKLQLDLSKAQIDANWEEIKAGHADTMITPTGLAGSALASFIQRRDSQVNEIHSNMLDSTLESSRQHAAEHHQKKDQTDQLLQNTRLINGVTAREYAGGIAGTVGAESALAGAVSAYRKEYEDRINEKTQLHKHFNLSSTQKQDVALGKDVTVSKGGVSYTFVKTDDFSREAAIEDKLKTGSFKEIEEIIKESGGTGKTSAYATSIAQYIMPNGIQNKAVYLGSKTIDDIAQGKIVGDAGLNSAVVYNLMEGKVKDEVLAAMDAEAIRRMFTVAKDPATLASIDPAQHARFQENVLALHESANHILDTDILSRNASKSARDVLEDNRHP